MDVTIVVESIVGATRRAAEAIAEGMRPWATVSVVDIAAAEPDSVATDLLVVGEATHAHGLSRGTTGLVAMRDSGPRTDGTLREWLRTLHAGAGHGAAAFDTRFGTVLGGSAAHGIARRLEHRGYRLVAPPASFFVEETSGPLCFGERERARDWGRQLVAQLLPA
jgi:hypothetical protein